MVRAVLRSVLMTSGHDVFVTTTGTEVLELASRMSAVLVVLDLNMPKVNGLVACERLRLMPGYADTPIAMLTAYYNESARDAAIRVGSTLFLGKPFQPAGLLAALAPYLSAKRPAGNGIGGVPGSDLKRANGAPQRSHALDHGKNVLDVCRGEGNADGQLANWRARLAS